MKRGRARRHVGGHAGREPATAQPRARLASRISSKGPLPACMKVEGGLSTHFSGLTAMPAPCIMVALAARPGQIWLPNPAERKRSSKRLSKRHSPESCPDVCQYLAHDGDRALAFVGLVLYSFL